MQDFFKQLLKRCSSNDGLWLTCVILFSIAIMSAIPILGIPDGRDLSQHVQFASTYFDAISNGDFFPGWGANENFGYGSIGIRFYPPLSYYLIALTRFLVGNWYDAIWLNFICWMTAGGIGMYIWAKEWLSPCHSAAAAALYVVVPYHLSQIYQLMLIAEFAAAAVLPFCFLFATRVCLRGRTPDVLLLGASVAILVLTHIPTALTGLIGLTVFTLFMIEREKVKFTLLKLTIAASIGLLLSAFHWIKIVTEIGWLKHNSAQYTSGFYDYSFNLFPMYLTAGDKYGQRLLSLFDIIIVLTIVLIVPALICYLRSRHDNIQAGPYKRILLALSVTGFLAIFLMSWPSAFLWEALPLFQKIQFPWRWLSVASLIGSLSFVLCFVFVSERAAKQFNIFRYLALGIIIAIALFDLTQSVILSAPLSRRAFETKVSEWKAQEGCQCWWTNWADPKALKQTRNVEADGRDVSAKDWQAESRRFVVKAGEPTNARVATFYYPHWKAKINGRPVKVKMGDNGEIIIPVKSDLSDVTMKFEEPLIVSAALVISGVFWVLLILILGWIRFRGNRSETILELE